MNLKRAFIALVIFAAILVFFVLKKVPFSQNKREFSRYEGTLLDAMTQWETDGDSLEDLLEKVNSGGVKRVAIAVRRPKRSVNNEEVAVSWMKKYPNQVILISPKYFHHRRFMKKGMVDEAIRAIQKNSYHAVSEVMYRHADKLLGDTTEKGETHIKPNGKESIYLLEKLAPLKVPFFVHWEFYKFEEDLPEFEKLFSRFPKQIFVLAHMGFGSPRQIEQILARHPNVFSTISKRDVHFDYFASSAISLGDGMVDQRGTLKVEWRDFLKKFSKRLLFATDSHKDYMWKNYPEIIGRFRDILGQVPLEVAEDIAFRNAERLYKLEPIVN